MDYAERKPPVTPCETCRVELLDENDDAAAIFQTVRRQAVTVQDGDKVYIDLSIPAVESAMRIRGVKDQWACLQKVRRLWYAMREREG